MRNLKIVALASAVLLNNNVTLASNADDRYVYIGTELGISEPVVKSFVEKRPEGDTDMRLKQSKMFGARIGYSFYPNMAVEISATHQPKYRLGYLLPANKAFGIPRTYDITKISSNVVTLNFLYEFEKQKFGLKPYVIFGAGVAQITIEKKDTSAKAFGVTPLTIFKVVKNKQNCFAYQMGGGVSKDISDNFAIDLGAKLQVVKDIKINFDSLDPVTRKTKSGDPIKKTIGVGEFTLGFTFKIPVR